MAAAVTDLRGAVRAHLDVNHLSVRAAAKAMGVSFSALARFVRGQTIYPGPHMDLAMQRLLGWDTPPCACSRCQGRVTLEERVERLEDCLHLDMNLQLLKEHLCHVEQILSQTTHLLHTLGKESNPCQQDLQP